MNRQRKQKAAAHSNGGGFWTKLIDKARDNIITVIIMAVGSVLVLILAPWINSAREIFPDRGSLEPMGAPSVLLGSSLDLNSSRIIPSGKLDNGQLHVYATHRLEQIPTQRDFPLKQIAAKTFLKDALPTQLTFIGREEGKAYVLFSLTSGDSTLELLRGWPVEITRHRDYAGDWHLQLGDSAGTMHTETTEKDDRRVYGYYSLDDGPMGVISGHFDGSGFSGFLTNGDSTGRWEITADTHDDGKKIQANGKARFFVGVNADWIAHPEGDRDFSISMQ